MLDLQATYRLSRYVFIRPVDSELVLESALSNVQFKIQNSAILLLLHTLARPFCPSDLLAGLEAKEREAVESFLQMCELRGLLSAVDGNGVAEEEVNHLSHWEFHDLLFHARSRFGKTLVSVGATLRFLESFPPEPCRKEAASSAELPLYRPDIESQKATGVTFTSVLESRRSRYGLGSLTAEQLGEFLYRACRIAGEAEAPAPLDKFLKKVYPSGGSLHSLEIYVVISACQEIDPGLYYYNGADHKLAQIRKIDAGVSQLLERAKQSVGGLPADPPVLFVFSARFRRTAWKYQSIAYRALLLEVGGLYQTMYLVATAMGLAPCALGCGDSVHFAALINSDYYLETSVGEFILGGRNPGVEKPGMHK
jgi:oxazoline/thiazoline dehydrogenase